MEDPIKIEVLAHFSDAPHPMPIYVKFIDGTDAFKALVARWKVFVSQEEERGWKDGWRYEDK